MINGWFDFILLVFASFRLTRLIVYDKITRFIRQPFHKEVEEVDSNGDVITFIEIKGKGLRHWIGELLSCYWCTGIWCTAILIVVYLLWPVGGEVLIVLLAVAGAAGICEAILQRLID
ncbi:DUF1360 domain-containing protein [Ornithinibacillus bavariensis]|uniref:Membrane protein n=1 Tax=Ornithinibacillus bavariensis TaxID=545502 RepID=A0A920C4P3_9BACI|nr:DUF1360 domain-containing protein [Ornithinibacillus bavariensis]GIO25931.1 membrane protein [Ornithinibacillus bavariensis]HAM79669.1 sporulation protein [Ornithinibacillus sp.]